MQERKLIFKESKKQAGSVKSFRFIPQQPFDFQPGQFAQLIFDQNNLANKELNKYLSFSVAPGRGYIEFTKKLSQSLFSEKLDKLSEGDEIIIRGPLGNCVFKKNYKKIAFLVGGIGITPIISILGYIAKEKINTQAFLFYSNRSRDEIAFKEELDNWQKKYSNIEVVYTLTSSAEPNFIFGRINEKLVLEKIRQPKDVVFFLFGPPKMVVAMSQLCDNIGCSQEKVKKESFIGY